MKSYRMKSCLLVSILLLTLVGCTQEPILEPGEVSLGFSSLIVNGGGEKFGLNVIASGEWTLSVEQNTDSWISVTPDSGIGNTLVTVTVSPNDHIGDKARLLLSSAGIVSEAVITAGEVCFLKETFDAKKAPLHFPYPEIEYFTGWEKYGIGAEDIIISGDNSYVTSFMSSEVSEGFSGKNNILLENSTSVLNIDNLNVKGSKTGIYTLKFAVYIDDADIQAYSEVCVSTSPNRDVYIPLDLTVEGESKWKTATATFGMFGANSLYLMFKANVPNVYIDDVTLINGSDVPETSKLIVSTLPPTDIEKTTAVLHGTWAYSGIDPIVENGFEYKLNYEGELFSRVKSDNVDLDFSYMLTGLEEGESYLCRAYAVTSSGEIVYGQDVTMITYIDPVSVSIKTVRDYFEGQEKRMPASWTLNAAVMSDFENGNMEASRIAIADGIAPGSGIIVNVVDAFGIPVDHSFKQNSSLEISLRGAKISGVMPIVLTVPLSQIRETDGVGPFDPVEITTFESMNEYDGMLVKFSDTQPLSKYVTRPWGYGVNETPGVNKIRMYSAIAEYDVCVYPSASFKNLLVGKCKGSLIGICSVSPDGSISLMPRNENDICLDQSRTDLIEKVVLYEDFGAGAGSTGIKFNKYKHTFEDEQTLSGVNIVWVCAEGKIQENENSSSGYTGASGAHMAYVNKPKDARDITLTNLNTMGKKYMHVTMGVSFMNNKPTTAESGKNNFTLSVSTDKGKTWTDVPYNIIEDGTSDAIWGLLEIDPSFIFPEAENVWMKAHFVLTNGRLDDVRIIRYE